jgi:uncharacterized protein
MSELNETLLRDTRYPVSQIADDLLPYLNVLVTQFAPLQVILFGSYAYGNPRADSDVDLLVIKEMREAPVFEASKIRHASRPIRLSG